MTQNKDSKTREVDRSPLGQATPVSFLYMTYGQLRDGCQSRDGRNAGEKALVDHRRSWNKESRWDGAAWKPSRELGSLPILRAMVRAWPRQRRNAFFRSAAGRIIRHTRLLTSCQQLQPSSAVVSAAVVGTGLLRDRGRPLHAAFVLTEFKNQRETGFP